MFHIRELRENKGINMREAARLLNMPYTTYVNYEKGLREPTSEILIQIADFYGTTIDYLVGRTTGASTLAAFEPMIRDLSNIANIIPAPETRKIPLVGTIACGTPILAQQNIEEYLDIPKELGGDFALICKGDSMINARIFDGDVVYIRQQETVESGEIAAVLNDDGEATLKRIRIYNDHIVLEPENPMYPPRSFWNEEMNNIRILGKAIAFTSAVR